MRSQPGMLNGQHVLKNWEVRKIRNLYGKSRGKRFPPTGMSTYELAVRFCVCASLIGGIIRRERWVHI